MKLEKGIVTNQVFKDMQRRYNLFKKENKREPKIIYIEPGRKEYVTLTVFKDMEKRYENFKKEKGREPLTVQITPPEKEAVNLEKGIITNQVFKDMQRRYNLFKKENGREPKIIYIEPNKKEYVTLTVFKDMEKRYENFKKEKGREPLTIQITPPEKAKEAEKRSETLQALIDELGYFNNATELYKLLTAKGKYKYYLNRRCGTLREAVRRIKKEGINCADACTLFTVILREIGYTVQVEHVRVKCNDGVWYGHYLLRVKGREFPNTSTNPSQWTIWDYVSATKTKRQLGTACCVAGFKHLDWDGVK